MSLEMFEDDGKQANKFSENQNAGYHKEVKDLSGRFEQLRKLAAREIVRRVMLATGSILDTDAIENTLLDAYIKHEQLFLRYKKELEGLTAGGSEYADSPERCAERVKESRENYLRIIRETIPARNKWSQLCAELGLGNHREATVDQAIESIKFYHKSMNEKEKV